MAVDTPIVYCFIHENKYCVYDLSSGHIFIMNKKQYIEIQHMLSYGISGYMELENDSQERRDILHLLKKGYFNLCTIPLTDHSLTPYTEDLLNRRICGITLQVTRDCNMRCRYCQFANENIYERNHSEEIMDLETAKKSIDFLYFHSSDAKDITVGFYGGEPLLNYNLIKETIIYCNELFELKDVQYYITTNGLLLTDSIIDDMVKFDINLTISLDGPEAIQNRHRKQRFSGNDSFEIIYQNILKIKSEYPDYFDKKVSFHPVLMKDDDISEVLDFYKNVLNIPSDNVTPTFATMTGIDYSYEETSSLCDENDQYSKEFYKKLLSDIEYDPGRMKDSIVLKNSPEGSCIPGLSRLFVNIKGDLFPCERVIENNNTCIGNLHDGFDMKQVKSLLNLWKINQDECSHCWAFRFCMSCASSCICSENQDENEKVRKIKCDYEKTKVSGMFRKYVKDKYNCT